MPPQLPMSPASRHLTNFGPSYWQEHVLSSSYLYVFSGDLKKLVLKKWNYWLTHILIFFFQERWELGCPLHSLDSVLRGGNRLYRLQLYINTGASKWVDVLWIRGSLAERRGGGSDRQKIIDLPGGQIKDPSSQDTVFCSSSQQLPRLCLGPLNGFLSWHITLQGPSTCLVRCFQN